VLAGCSIFEGDSQRAHDQTLSFNTPAAFTTADARIITQRQHPILNNRVVCTEPSPDVTKAVSTALQGNAQGGNGAVTAGLGFSGGSAEAAAELAGRSTALLGLRDGLFRACEAYANGVIGADAYSLVLSRYGQLMATLFLGQDITGAAGTGAAVLATSAAIALGAQQSGGNASTPKTTTTTTTGGKSASATPAVDPATSPTAHVLLATATGDAADDKKAPAKPSGDASTTKSTPDDSTKTPTAAVAAAGVQATAALAIARMNEDYIGLDLNLPGTIIVACINEYDPTRMHRQIAATGNDGKLLTDAAGNVVMQDDHNSWLKDLCDKLKTLPAIKAAVADTVTALKELPIIRPDTVAAAAGSTVSHQAPKPVANPKVKQAQEDLQKAGFYHGDADGLMGPQTKAAIEAFQKKNNLPVTGEPDDKTLERLKAPSDGET
jgi:hypothetical protein